MYLCSRILFILFFSSPEKCLNVEFLEVDELTADWGIVSWSISNYLTGCMMEDLT
jgi:hypothetical protein